MSHPNEELIRRFYDAFGRCDGDAMAACYTPDARFDDPVFPGLKGEEPGDMWRMLTARSTDLKIDLEEHEASEETGSAHWIATYTFTQTGRPVVNDVRATFRFRDGLIAEHRDDFSFYRWSKQALGPPGLLLGWTPIIKGATRKKARAGLDQFRSGSPTAA
jgi:ketosteroid isomerase-like protein